MIITKGKVRGKTLLLGFPGIGMVGFIAVDYLIKKLKAKRTGWMFRKELPEIAYVNKGELGLPIEIFSWKNLLLLKVNVVMERETMNLVAAEIMEWAKKKGVSKVVVVGGLAGKGKKEVFGVSNSFGQKFLEKLELKKFTEELRIFGPMAASMIYGEKEKIPVVCMLPISKYDRPDPEAASRAVRFLCNVFGLEVDTKDLIKEAKKIEKKIAEMSQKKDDDIADRMFR